MCTTREGTVLCKNNRLAQLHKFFDYLSPYHFEVPPEVTVVFPALVHYDVQQHGVCIVKAWPSLLTTDDMDVFKNGSCAIAKDPLSYIDIYTTALFFTLEMNINSTCFSVSCHTNHGQVETKNINISKC